MVRTADNAVARMNRLLDQLRKQGSEAPDGGDRLRVADLVAEAVERYADRAPRPDLDNQCGDSLVQADHDRLVNVIGNIIENGQQATPPDGKVEVIARSNSRWTIITVRDTGSGMSADFVEHQLFAPFATTKGIAGIGIGAYQSRQYLRSIGGDLSVQSSPGRGSEFMLHLPRIGPT
jgi:signal transduction histidine kinase